MALNRFIEAHHMLFFLNLNFCHLRPFCKIYFLNMSQKGLKFYFLYQYVLIFLTKWKNQQYQSKAFVRSKK